MLQTRHDFSYHLLHPIRNPLHVLRSMLLFHVIQHLRSHDDFQSSLLFGVIEADIVVRGVGGIGAVDDHGELEVVGGGK